MSPLHSALATTLLLAPAAAQGALPLDGTYVFSEIQGEHGSDCGGPPVFDLVGSQTGTIAFQTDGTAMLTETEHGACEDGTFSTGVAGGAAAYSVAVDGTVTLDPGPDEFHAVLRPDLSVLVGAGDLPTAGPSLVVATRLSSGLDASALSGLYVYGRIVLVNDGTGTRGETWYGAMSFNGAGGYSASSTKKIVSATGATTTSSPPFAGSYSVAGDGKLTLDGMNGGVTADGTLFHAVDTTGQDVALWIGVKQSTGATDALLGGTWGHGAFSTAFGASASLPEFCSSLGAADIDAAAKTYALAGDEICADASGESFGPYTDGGTYKVYPDGSMAVFDAGLPPGITGAVDPSGTRALVADVATGAEISASVLVRKGELPTPFGAATLGTGGLAPLLSSNGFAYLGNAAFAFEIASALPSAQAFLGVSVQPGVGLPLLGGTLWIDPLTPVLIQPVAVGASGAAAVPVPIPSTPTLEGQAVHAQILVVDPGGPAGFAMTAGLHVPLMR